MTNSFRYPGIKKSTPTFYVGVLLCYTKRKGEKWSESAYIVSIISFLKRKKKKEDITGSCMNVQIVAKSSLNMGERNEMSLLRQNQFAKRR